MKILLPSLLLILPISACTTTNETQPARPIITLDENYSYDFDIQPGDQLDLVLQPETLAAGSPQERCAHYGGTYHLDQVRLLEICQDVDF